METAQQPWHLLGAGSLGCLFAAYLQEAGITAELIVRDDATLGQLHANGGITLMRGSTSKTIAVAATTPDAVQDPVTQLLICTKAHQTLAAVTALKSKISAEATIVLLQNGMGVREQLQPELPTTTILHALSTEGAFRTSRFHVTHAGCGETVIGATAPNKPAYAQAIANSLRCELPIVAVSDIERRLWLKLAVNSAINPLTALHNCRNGELLNIPNIDAIVTQLCDELAHIAIAENIVLSAREMREEIYRVIRATAHNKSSMLQDIQAQRATEIDFINGFIVQRAHAHDLPCAQHERLLSAVRARLQP